MVLAEGDHFVDGDDFAPRSGLGTEQVEHPFMFSENNVVRSTLLWYRKLSNIKGVANRWTCEFNNMISELQLSQNRSSRVCAKLIRKKSETIVLLLTF